jgi:hypothetical protein
MFKFFHQKKPANRVGSRPFSGNDFGKKNTAKKPGRKAPAGQCSFSLGQGFS